MLWAFAFAKPLFDELSDDPEFFVARGNTRWDIILLGVGLTLGPPTLFVLCEAALVPLRAVWRQALHLTLVALLIAAIVLQAIDGLGASAGILIAISLALGAAGAFAYARTQVAPGVLTVLSPAPIVFLVIFLLISPVSELVLPQAEKAKASGDIRGRAPVVLIVFDELSGGSLTGRDGRIDASRFPNFAALAKDATWYRNATTVADQTSRAVPAILSGVRPPKERLPTASDYPHSVFTLLGGSYAFNVDEPVTDLCPTRLCGDESRPPPGRRLSALFDDLSVVSMHLLLPDGTPGPPPGGRPDLRGLSQRRARRPRRGDQREHARRCV